MYAAFGECGGSIGVPTADGGQYNNNNNSGLCNHSNVGYFTRDLLTEPPTVIQIVASPNCGLQLPGSGNTAIMHTISILDIEPTAGWLSDRNNASLDICFLHSFRKCSGKVKDKDPRTCHQIHVKQCVLDKLRQNYEHPIRNYYCRTMKANITDKFSQVLSLLVRRKCTLQYLEFKTDDIAASAGSIMYENQYREWLLDPAPPALNNQQQEGRIRKFHTENFISSSDLCWDFALTSHCPHGASCPCIHGYIAKALTKDRFVRTALEEMSKGDQAAIATKKRGSGSVPRTARSKSGAVVDYHFCFAPSVQQQQQQQAACPLPQAYYYAPATHSTYVHHHPGIYSAVIPAAAVQPHPHHQPMANSFIVFSSDATDANAVHIMHTAANS